MHKEGLGTESVRRKLRDGTDLDPGELSERLDRLSEGVESLHLQRLTEEESISQEMLETVLEKQDRLMSAVSDLTRRVEDLLSTRARTVSPDDVEEAVREEEILAHRTERPFEANRNAERTSSARRYSGGADTGNVATQTVESGPASGVAVDEFAIEEEDDSSARIFSDPSKYPAVSNRRDKFGALARRRRRGVLALLLLGLLAVAVPAVLLATIAGEEAEQASVGGEEVEQPATDEQPVEEDSPMAKESEEEDPSGLVVPDFVGLTFMEAEAGLAEAGLGIGDLREEISYEIPEGEVISQEPLAGTEVEPGDPMNLVVSAGPPKVEAAPVIGDAGTTQYPVQYLPSPVGGAQYPGGAVQPEPVVPVVPEVY